jgi:hypothetical protein
MSLVMDPWVVVRWGESDGMRETARSALARREAQRDERPRCKQWQPCCDASEDEMGIKGRESEIRYERTQHQEICDTYHACYRAAGASVKVGWSQVATMNASRVLRDTGKGAGRQRLSSLINGLGRVGRLKQRGVAAGVRFGFWDQAYTAT